MNKLIVTITLAAAVLTPCAAVADEREALEHLRATTTNLINLLVQEGVLSKDKADALMHEAAASAKASAEKAAAAANAQQGDVDPKVVRVQYVPEFVKNQLRNEIKQEVMAKAQSEGWAYPGSIPEWMNRIAWEGDLRLRYEKDAYPDGNVTPFNLKLQGIDSVNNTSEDRERWRIRARLGASIKVNDYFSGGIRMTTGSLDDPVSPNQTLANNNGNGSGKFSFALDRAFIKYDPNSWSSVVGGRFANPWLSTDLVWDPDLAFDGLAVALKPKLSDSFKGFATLGAFPVQEVETNGNDVLADDKWLYGAQAGFEWTSANKSAFKLGLAYYDFTNVQGVRNTPGSTAQNKTAVQFHQKGNTLFDITDPAILLLPGTTHLYGLASEFREVNLTGSLDIAVFNPVHVVLTGDYVKNVGFDENEVQARNPVSPVGGDTAWMAKVLVGMPETLNKNDWNVFAAYKRLETNSVLDSYSDSDFHLGGTNTQGWIAGANYGLDKNTWLTLRWLSADAIDGSTYSADVLLLDLNAKF